MENESRPPEQPQITVETAMAELNFARAQLSMWTERVGEWQGVVKMLQGQLPMFAAEMQHAPPEEPPK